MNDEELILLLLTDPTLTMEEAAREAAALRTLYGDDPLDPSFVRDILLRRRSGDRLRGRATPVSAA